MGIGDEVLCTGEARRAQMIDPRPVCVLDKHGRPRWHPLWEQNPRFSKTEFGAQTIVNGGGCRPYINAAQSTPERWRWTEWRATPGELPCIHPSEKSSVGWILIEPHIKPKASPNKQWGWDRWQALVDLDRSLPWLQIGAPGTKVLAGVTYWQTASFEQACHHLQRSRAAVLPEGALHHAAAALGVQAVVLFGGYISPLTTGYDLHKNIWVDDPEALGWRIPHPACVAAWDTITPPMVMEKLTCLLKNT